MHYLTRDQSPQVEGLQQPQDLEDGFDSYTFPSLVLTVLQVEGRKFPVYWIHYVCWQAIVRNNMEQYHKEIPLRLQSEECTMAISADDWWWTEKSLTLIQQVMQKKGTPLFPFIICLYLDINDFGKRLIEEAKSLAPKVPMPFVRYVLGDRKSYFQKLSDEFHAARHGGTLDLNLCLANVKRCR